MITASVIELRSNEPTLGRGHFDFHQAPARGDRITVPSVGGGVDVVEVLYVEHHQASPPQTKGVHQEANVSVYVRRIDKKGQ